jgi:hypothetical protein
MKQGDVMIVEVARFSGNVRFSFARLDKQRPGGAG